MCDGSSLDAVELASALSGRAPRASSRQSDTQSCVCRPKLAKPCALLLSCGSAACTPSQLAQLHAHSLHSWLSRMRAVSACSVSCTPIALSADYAVCMCSPPELSCMQAAQSWHADTRPLVHRRVTRCTVVSRVRVLVCSVWPTVRCPTSSSRHLCVQGLLPWSTRLVIKLLRAMTSKALDPGIGS